VVGLALGVAGVWIFFAVVSVFSPNGDRQQARTPLTPLLQPHEFSEPGVVLENDEVKVTAAVVNHPPVVPAFAYRFDTADRSIVISGDTNENAPGLVRLAQGADVLVHEFLSLRLYNANPNPNTELAAHVRRAHTPATEVGRIATAAKVKTLVFSHFVPSAQSQYLSTKCDSPTTGYCGRHGPDGRCQ
jgi:ribonuclease BN (tRNA processing enzyme)